MKIYSNFWKIISNNCVVFILIALHLIHLIFENLWINIIIETNQKVKADKKHGLLYIFGNKNQHKFSKTTQNYCIIYARSLHFIYLIFENLWMNIITENCPKKMADKKHDFLYIFGYKNQHKFSKTTQNCCIINARSLHLINLFFENLWIDIITENCRTIKAYKKNTTFCTFLATNININFQKLLRIIV